MVRYVASRSSGFWKLVESFSWQRKIMKSLPTFLASIIPLQYIYETLLLQYIWNAPLQYIYETHHSPIHVVISIMPLVSPPQQLFSHIFSPPSYHHFLSLPPSSVPLPYGYRNIYKSIWIFQTTLGSSLEVIDMGIYYWRVDSIYIYISGWKDLGGKNFLICGKKRLSIISIRDDWFQIGKTNQGLFFFHFSFFLWNINILLNGSINFQLISEKTLIEKIHKNWNISDWKNEPRFFCFSNSFSFRKI